MKVQMVINNVNQVFDVPRNVGEFLLARKVCSSVGKKLNYDETWEKWLRNGSDMLTDKEKNLLGRVPETPSQFVFDFFDYLAHQHPIFVGDSFQVIKTFNDDLMSFPIERGRKGCLVGELIGQTEEEISEPRYKVLRAFKYCSGTVRVGKELLADPVFDIRSHVIRTLVNSFSVIEEEVLFGNGLNRPEGILWNMVPEFITPIDFTQYFIDNPGIEAVGLSNTFTKLLPNINRERIINSSSMPFGTIVAGSHLAGGIIRFVNELKVVRLAERFADFGEVGYLGFIRVDAKRLDYRSDSIRLFELK